ncbi:DUF2892 domain-containing protein [Pseudomonas alliivorans]|uniref:YgaP family membrane protein n=1 Tax=Pseudomonas alliivorans TaxID=2810613 RepID=UPI0020912ED3|nr:DUF2892 domain-containing protein [Pseudomonas alliivorans]MCO5364712.1 DUF2892 domain-containing protein [Pseudomonas alliivorans]MEE4731061.1 DUF2892 domain-containing protein [Pseudomonas alliivorans]MEE4915668.1 DUF2892 domain-containing protein [Pseudomonas alliivorans]MEE4995711.1 DUF2892 domain-containing protein [Pseudomonas alliivorans]MEE5123072.1 DUF2892 domain-containing protein [Pseudomonas alliivorans]
MRDTPIIERIDTPEPFQPHPDQNVQGWERIGSLAGGVLMMGKGVRRGGFLGLIQLAIGGAVLARGITGHCSAKSLMEKGRSDLQSARSTIERAGAELSELQSNAEKAVKTATVNGIDALTEPKPGV